MIADESDQICSSKCFASF